MTLVEILVCIAIIMVLAVLVLQGLDSFKDRAKVAKCLSNMHGIGNGLQIYAAENNHILPGLTEENMDVYGIGGGSVDIRFVLYPYDSIFWNMVCPADPRRQFDPAPENPSYLSYVYPSNSEIDLAELERAITLVQDGSYYHGRQKNWRCVRLFSDNHCEVEKF